MTEEELLKAKTYRDRVSTVTQTGKRNWVYALKPKGKFYFKREVAAFIYLIIFFALPLIKMNGMPFFMVNVVEGKFILFSKIFWPQDFFIFAIAMITMIVFVVLFTVVFGRLFCGWACPQTIFMEFVFRKIEWWIEGSPSQQKAMNNGEWTSSTLFKKTLKHIVFFTLSFLIANTFLAYIISFDKLIQIIKEPIQDHILLFTGLLFFTFLFYSVFAFVREIVCTTICPYGRLQGVMFDKDTMQVSYDYSRGEPRGKINKKDNNQKLGDCIDCKKCIMVCPTGIDIRNGIQMECVGCTACIDACDEVMDKINRPQGLIRYASENEISVGKKFKFNTRMKAYSVLLVVLIIFMSILIATRKTIDTHILRAKGQMYQEMPNNVISNLFEANVVNKTNKDVSVNFEIKDNVGAVKLIGRNNVILKKEALNHINFFVEIPKEKLDGTTTSIKINVIANDGTVIQSVKTEFLGPFVQKRKK